MRADVVVIGAGALGLAAALHCALAGRPAVVIERDTAGSQASGRAAGLFKSVQADRLRTDLARRSIARAVTFADWAGVPLTVTKSGSYLIARTDAHKQFLHTEHRQSRGWGTDVREASPRELAEGVGYYRATGRELALWCPEDVYIAEPADMIRAYLRACRLHGTDVLEREEVIGVTLSGGRVAGVETTRRSISARVVIDAAGAWTRQVAALAGAVVPVAPVRHQLMITVPAESAGREGADHVRPEDPIVRVVDAAVYLRPARGGLMIGGFESRPLAFNVDAPPRSADEMPVDSGVLDRLAALVGREVPGTRLPAAEHRGGMFTMSPDGRFVLGPVPDVPGLWVASGCNGSGFSSSLALGEALAHWIGGAPGNAAALAPSRFGPLTAEALIKDGVWQYEHYYDPAVPPPGADQHGDG